MKKSIVNGEIIIRFDSYKEMKECAVKKLNTKGNLHKRSFFVGNKWIRLYQNGYAVISQYK